MLGWILWVDLKSGKQTWSLETGKFAVSVYMFSEISYMVRVKGEQSWHPACTWSCLPRMVISVLVQGESWECDDFQNYRALKLVRLLWLTLYQFGLRVFYINVETMSCMYTSVLFCTCTLYVHEILFTNVTSRILDYRNEFWVHIEGKKYP